MYKERANNMKRRLFILAMSVFMIFGIAVTASFADDTCPLPGTDKYTVNYLDKDTGAVLAEQKVVTDKPIGSTVTEKALDINGYKVYGAAEKTITVRSSENIGMKTAWYRITPCSRLSYTNLANEKSVIVAKKGYSYIVWTPTALSEAGKQVIYKAVSNDVNGMFGAKYENFTFFSGIDRKYEGIRVTRDRLEFDMHCTWSMFCAAKYRTYTDCGKNEINFYYQAMPKETYKVNYLEVGTDKELAPQKVVTDVPVGTVINEAALNIDGYNVSGADSQELTVMQSKQINKTDFATPTDNNGGWKRITPCDRLNWVNEGTQRSVVVAKKGYYYVVWTLDPLTASEKEAIYRSFKANVNGMNGASYPYVKYISGNGASYGGVTVKGDAITFDYHCTWSLYAMGLYTKASEEVVDLASNEITFYYERIPEVRVSYTVRYMNVETNEVIRPDEVRENIKAGTYVTETAEQIKGFVPLYDEISFEVIGDEVVMFIYYEAIE